MAVHQAKAQLSVVATVANNEGTAHDGHHHRHFGTIERLLRHVDVQVLTLRGAVADASVDPGVVVVGEHDAHEGRQQDHGVEAEPEAQPAGREAELEPADAAHREVDAVDQEVEVVRNHLDAPKGDNGIKTSLNPIEIHAKYMKYILEKR